MSLPPRVSAGRLLAIGEDAPTLFPRLVSGTTSPESATTTTLKVPAAAGNGAESDPVYDAPLASPPVWVTRPSSRSPAFTVPSVER